MKDVLDDGTWIDRGDRVAIATVGVKRSAPARPGRRWR